MFILRDEIYLFIVIPSDEAKSLVIWGEEKDEDIVVTVRLV